MGSWNKLYEWQGVEANQVSDEGLPATSAVISSVVDQRVAVHASVADYLETFSVGERLGATFEISQINFFLPLDRNFELLHLFVTDSSSFEGFKPKAKNAQRVVNVHLGNS